MKYFLLSSQRSGSDLLRHSLLSLFAEHSDGPDEWIMHPITRKNLGLPEDFQTANTLILQNPQLLVDKMSEHSHRKVMYNHILSPKKLPDTVPIIHLIRKDSWAQAKSLWVMKQKKIPPHVDANKHQALIQQQITLELNIDEVKHLAKKLLNQKILWYLALINRPNTLTLYYEDDLCDINLFRNKTLSEIEAFLNKKRVIEDYEFNLKKTSSLYIVKNLDPFNESRYVKIYYFNPKNINKFTILKMRLKLMLQKPNKKY